MAKSILILIAYFCYYDCSNAGSDTSAFDEDYDRENMLTRGATYLLR